MKITVPTAMPVLGAFTSRSTATVDATPGTTWAGIADRTTVVERAPTVFAVSLRTFFILGTCALGAMWTTGAIAPSTAAAAGAAFRYEHGQPLNNLRITPGATFSVTVAEICRPGYASSVRNVPQSEKAAVYGEYGIASHRSGQYEVDHLISLELGGSNAIANLWPEPNDHPRGYLNSKDIIENRLHALVCAHDIALATAQRLIATDWVAEYHRLEGRWPSAPSTPSSRTPTASSRTSPTSTVATGPRAVAIVSLVSPVSPGSTETLIAHSSKAGDSCTLTVTLPSGRVSTASGLGRASTDGSGTIRWTWKIGSSTGAGTATAVVSCADATTSRSFAIT